MGNITQYDAFDGLGRQQRSDLQQALDALLRSTKEGTAFPDAVWYVSKRYSVSIIRLTRAYDLACGAT